MDWLINLFAVNEGIAHTVLLLSIVIAVGVLLGKVKFGGIALGVTWVLFAGILAGHLGFTADKELLTFLQDFGLILFVFCIGLQVGPGFFESFKKGGVPLNMMSVAIILLNVAVMFGCYYLFFDHSNTNLAMLTGTLYGAVTNTPGLGAATEAISSLGADTFGGQIPLIANGYACAYPLGVLGIIGATILVRYISRISTEKEEKILADAEAADPHEIPHVMALRADNDYISGRTILELSDFLKRDFVITRMIHEDEFIVPNRNTVITKGDELYVVCAQSDVDAVKAFIGPETGRKFEEEENKQVHMVSRRIIVTNPKINGKTLGKMHFSSVFGVNVTRISRQRMDLFASRNHHFHVGDRIMVVGPEENVQRVADIMGDSVKRLNHPNLATIFIGIFLGIIFGQIPIMFPGMPVPLKLGLAGGPLIIAILIGRFGHLCKLVTFTTTSANMMIREIGLALFLACVGIKAGAGFWQTITEGDGLMYVLCGFLMTVIPILIVAPLARWKYKFNYFTLMGAIAGTYTDPPALGFANASCSKEAPAIGYSTVYPLSMFLRILTAQLIILFACA